MKNQIIYKKKNYNIFIIKFLNNNNKKKNIYNYSFFLGIELKKNKNILKIIKISKIYAFLFKSKNKKIKKNILYDNIYFIEKKNPFILNIQKFFF
jgi:hypothetical protein